MEYELIKDNFLNKLTDYYKSKNCLNNKCRIMTLIWSIIKGHYHELIGHNQHLYDTRYQYCGDCEYRKRNKCRICGCRLSAKLRLMEESCPANKWK